jgi:DNA-binding FadR family transcriptional regulator
MQSELEKKAVVVAEQIQQDILDSNYLPGMVIGSEPQLCARYGVGRTALREATHLLQFRGLARMRRGPSGGLVVERPGEGGVVRGLASLISGGRAEEILEEARLTLSRVASSLIEFRASNSTPLCARITLRTGEAAALADLASHADNSALQGLVVVFEALCAPAFGATPPYPKPDSTARRPENLFATQTAQLFGTSRSAQIARQLYARIQFNESQTIQRLGSESDLCARFAIGIPIARQVVRLLEEAGVLSSQRGRGRGLYLRKPTPDQIRHSIASYLVGCRAPGIDCWTLIEALEAQMASSSGFSSVHPRLVSTPGPAVMQVGANSGAITIGPEVNQRPSNPILVAILEGVRTYSRLRSRERNVSIGLPTEHGKSFRSARPAPMHQKIVPAEPLRPPG